MIVGKCKKVNPKTPNGFLLWELGILRCLKIWDKVWGSNLVQIEFSLNHWKNIANAYP
jgi:hypothetical protein